MRIVIDMQGAQTESRFRGIGRYTLSFAQALANNRGEHEIILALSGLFPDTIDPIRYAFDGVLPQRNILVWQAPGPVCAGRENNEIRREAAELMREAFLASLRPDVIHVCSLFEGYVDDAVTSIGRLDTTTPVSVTLYDLIPLLNADHYLKPNPSYERYYLSKIESLKRASLHLTISNFSRQEVIETLGIAEGHAINISTAIDEVFRPIILDAHTSSNLRQKYAIQRPFVLYTGGADDRKNLPRLIEAFAALPVGLRRAHQLVFAGRMPEGEISRLKDHASDGGFAEGELLFTGYVSDDELIHLYNLCSLYVFPSWHEGFGLPALEAMACGAPVIGSNTSSLPEVIGFDDALFDPFSVTAISNKIAQALSNNEFRNRLSSNGLLQAKAFSWSDTANRAMKAWETLAGEEPQNSVSWEQTAKQLDCIYRILIDKIASATSAGPSNFDADLRHIASCIAHNTQQLDQHLRPKTLPPSINWRIEGPFDSSYSLALVNREVARALSALGHRVALHSTEGPGDFVPNEAFLSDKMDLIEMHRRSSTISSLDSDVVSRNLYPPRVLDMDSRLNALHAYGWEESGFPSEYVDAFNLSLQGMTVMSEHVRKVMIDHGVTIPIEVSALGIDHWYRINSDKSFHISARSFRFLHVSSCFPRKGAEVMLRAYGKAFRASDDVTLIIKTFPNPHNEIHRWLIDARANDSGYPDVLILEEDYSEPKLKALYEQCHALVAPSCAEGFGLPMAEAMISGLPVITTGWSGQTDFCTQETAWLIDYKFARARTHFDLSASVWAEPDEDHLTELMREVYETPEDARQVRVAAGQRKLNEHFQWSQAAERMVEAARHWAEGMEVVTPRIGWVSTWNTRCGIAAYSEHLINCMPAPVTVLAAHTDSNLFDDAQYINRCWTAGDDDSLDDLSKAIHEHSLDTIVIQFNYGFFDLAVFAKFLNEQIDFGQTVVVTMHATTDPKHAPHKKLGTIAPTLMRCHRILVHSPNDMNRLKKLGLVDNVSLFPHGLIDYAPNTRPAPRNDEDFVIASYGFFLPHKGLLELIDAFAILRSKGMRVRLEMINAEYPAQESRDIIEQAKRKILTLGLNDTVSVCTDYLDDRECLDKLSKADLIVFPYQDTGESSSAAVRHGIASGRPVAVTPLSIFDDVAQAVYFLPGTSPMDIAEGIVHVSNVILSKGDIFEKKAQQNERWRTAHRHSKVGLRLNQMLLALTRDSKRVKQRSAEGICN